MFISRSERALLRQRFRQSQQHHRCVLVQRGMERGHPPPVSIARALAPSVAAERNGNWHEEAADGNCNWFQQEITLGLIAVNTGGSDTKIVGIPRGGLGCTAEARTQSERPTG